MTKRNGLTHGTGPTLSYPNLLHKPRLIQILTWRPARLVVLCYDVRSSHEPAVRGNEESGSSGCWHSMMGYAGQLDTECGFGCGFESFSYHSDVDCLTRRFSGSLTPLGMSY